ncbi:hypothetical protein NEOLEDRAFT_194819 [Neolentinus lepideus HHB14362 ss-1]|uniref:Mid2 domain-containing protein n=1 Tax=Neolentinus lepideus HHB14362 ss-1 TaxID=1314782 RepID=A0A165MF72_9AGAM|nr:hypothetical protein NEOLEDRAFT_194819 [Neolentinus lepideus HHB14362 ss-1]
MMPLLSHSVAASGMLFYLIYFLLLAPAYISAQSTVASEAEPTTFPRSTAANSTEIATTIGAIAGIIVLIIVVVYPFLMLCSRKKRRSGDDEGIERSAGAGSRINGQRGMRMSQIYGEDDANTLVDEPGVMQSQSSTSLVKTPYEAGASRE